MRVLLLVLAVACGRSSQEPVARARPSVTALEPTWGHPSGGKIMHIVGTGFDPHAQVEVWFGPKPARAMVVASDRIQVESPPGVEGEESDVSVKFADGTTARSPQRYRWQAPPHDAAE